MPETSKDRPVVMVSSTALDLPEHRKEVMDACLRMGMHPVMMEHLSAGDTTAAEKSLAMVDDAAIYLGVFAYRYGHVPEANNPEQISITEMEYDRAVERGIPRLIFLMDKSHQLTAADMEEETGDPAEAARRKVKLGELKKRAGKERVVASFKSPADLRALVIQSLVEHREPDLTKFHYVSDIPAPPEAFIAHPYTLLQTHRLVGRQPELNLLTDWVAKPDSGVYKARILNVVAVGGMGKSALTWQWFNQIAPQEMSPLAGRMWWSFYESDATFENFVTRALAYVSRRPLEEVQQIPAPDRETRLLAALDREPFLLVLDGLERILIAYARVDAAHLSDDDYDRQTANFVANAIGLPASAAQSFTGEHRLRKTPDPRAGSFLRKLSNVRASRILVSTRLYPADLQMVTGEPLRSCAADFLPGLADDDALELWRAFGAAGARDSLLPLFQRADNHPLLIQALASEVARYRPAPGDFDAWRRAHPDFDPFGLPLVQVKSHVLASALHGLDDKAQQVLRTVAAFRMPARYDTLTALLIGEGKACADERELDEVLTELEDRGLVGWDKRANRYDLHPLVRGVVWTGLTDDARRGIYSSFHTHFKSLPETDEDKVGELEDLTPAIELYNALIGLGRYDDAFEFFISRIDNVMLNRLSTNRQRVELLEMLFPTGLEQLPSLAHIDDQAIALNALAQGYQYIGRPGRAAPLFSRSSTISLHTRRDDNFSTSLGNLSEALQLLGCLRESARVARQALLIDREQKNLFSEAVTLQYLGTVLAVQGDGRKSLLALSRSVQILRKEDEPTFLSFAYSCLCLRAIWVDEIIAALGFADRARELAIKERNGRELIFAILLQGEATLGLADFAAADQHLHNALTRARMVTLVEEELVALISLAVLRRRQGVLGAAREWLGAVWEAAERGPYPLIHADACNVLAEVERDEGNLEKAVEAASRAYRLAWCDGPPFAYHWGLERARGLLRELGAGEPELPAFDESKFEPMPEVEIDPADEFGVGSEGER